jgi:hypothetical protein
LDGARAGTTAAFASGRSLEFVATFSGQAFQNVGFAKDFVFNTPFAMFTTIGGGQLSARSIGAADTATPLGVSFLGAPHRYRIDWSADTAVFSVDGNVVATHAFAVSGTMMPIASDFNTGNGAVTVDWMRLTSYASSGAFISQVFDAGVTATWGAFSWTARTPSGTSVAMSVNASNSSTPATSCTGFTPISVSGGTIGASSRFLQYCAQLSTSDAGQTPSLDDVTIGFSTGTSLRQTSASVSCTPTTVAVNGTTTCTATVTDTGGAGATTPTGTVSFTTDSGTFSGAGSCTLDAAGRCTVTYTAAVAGSHTITAPYSGDTSHATSSGSTSVTATATVRSTSTSLSCTPTTVPVNGTTTCTATVTDTGGAGATTPTGTVSFTTDSGTFSGGGSCVLDATGRCSVSYTPTVVGSHTITDSYSGDGTHATSSGSASVTTTARSTGTSVSCTPTTVPVNGTTTCTATVTDTAGAGGTTPTGIVTLTTDSGTFSGDGNCTLDATGRCPVTYTPTVVGAHTITSSYKGDSVHAVSSGTTAVTATTRSTSTSVSCSPATVVLNVATTCTATVTDTAGAGATTPTGTVTFSSSGGLFLLGATCSLSAGRCSVSYTPSLLGSTTVTGSYGGDGAHARSSGSATVTSVLSLGLGLASTSESSPTETRMTSVDFAEDR